MDTNKYARIELSGMNPEISIEEWSEIAKQNPNIKIENNLVFGYISEREYEFQMYRPDSLWRVGAFEGSFDDDYFENKHF